MVIEWQRNDDWNNIETVIGMYTTEITYIVLQQCEGKQNVRIILEY